MFTVKANARQPHAPFITMTSRLQTRVYGASPVPQELLKAQLERLRFEMLLGV